MGNIQLLCGYLRIRCYMITQARLRELLHYDPSTGVLTRLVALTNCVQVGDVAGYRNQRGYVRVMVDSSLYLAHRLAWLYMTGAFPENEIDHKDHVRDNNRWSNLREAMPVENARNQSMFCNNTSGVMGVSWNKARRKWKVSINAEGKRIHLGYFRRKAVAARVRKAAEIEYGFHENHGTD